MRHRLSCRGAEFNRPTLAQDGVQRDESLFRQLPVANGNASERAKPAGPKCSYQNLFASITGIVQLDYSFEGYPAGNCFQFPINGTLIGLYVSCLVPDPAGTWSVWPGVSVFEFGPSGWGDHNLVGYWDEWLQTDKGNIHLHSFGSFFDDTGLQSVLSRIVPDGTGQYMGATGVMTEIFSFKDYDPVANLSSPTASVRINGYICTR